MPISQAEQAALDQKQNAFLVVATLLAITALQLGISSPPGGLWSEDTGADASPAPPTPPPPPPPRPVFYNKAKAGSAVMARNCKITYFFFYTSNHSVFFTSLLATVLLVTHLEPGCFYIRWMVPICLSYSALVMGVNYITLTYCLNSLLSNVPWFAIGSLWVLAAVLITVAGIMGVYVHSSGASWTSLFKVQVQE